MQPSYIILKNYSYTYVYYNWNVLLPKKKKNNIIKKINWHPIVKEVSPTQSIFDNHISVNCMHIWQFYKKDWRAKNKIFLDKWIYSANKKVFVLVLDNNYFDRLQKFNIEINGNVWYTDETNSRNKNLKIFLTIFKMIDNC